MKGRLSMEVKNLLEEKISTRSRCNLETSTTLTTCSTHHSSTLKRSESSSTLPRTDSQISIIEDRYRTLELNYRHLLDETKRKGELFRKQKEDLEWYKSAHQRSQKELERLRTLIGFVKKAEFSTQTDQHSAESTKREKTSASLPKERRSPLHISKATATAKDWAQYCKGSSGLKKVHSRVRVEQSRGGFSKYKFVPSLALA